MATPRDRYLAVYGRKPVLEALGDPRLRVAKVLVAEGARGREIDEIERAAARRGVEVRRVTALQVSRISRNGRQDQGVVADVEAPAMRALDEWLEAPPVTANVLVLDGLTNPQNVGMILRTAVAAGIPGVVVPSVGVAELGPLVVKASAGVAFEAPVLRTRTAAGAVDALRAAGFRVYGLAAGADRTIYDPQAFAARAAFVLGGESGGLSVDVDEHVRIPMAADVESLNVAVAAGVLCFELVRRALA